MASLSLAFVFLALLSSCVSEKLVYLEKTSDEAGVTLAAKIADAYVTLFPSFLFFPFNKI
jgi:hypothetical protein